LLKLPIFDSIRIHDNERSSKVRTRCNFDTTNPPIYEGKTPNEKVDKELKNMLLIEIIKEYKKFKKG
jgi:hypothetical protein